MKLQALHESVGPDFSEFKEKLPSDMYSNFEELFGLYSKGFKYLKSEKKSGSDLIKHSFTNGLMDLEIDLGLSESKSDGNTPTYYAFFSVLCAVNDKYVIPDKNGNTSNRFVNFNEIFHDASDVSATMMKGRNMQKAITEFTDWYFELGNEHVKLKPTNYNIVEGYHNGSENRFVAYLGDFLSDKSADTDKIEQRIFK